MTGRRKILLGMGGATGAGLAYAVSRTPSAFWRHLVNDIQRDVLAPGHVPDPARWPDTGIHMAWLGHSTALVKIDGFTFITDPVFSRRAGVDLFFTNAGIKRLVDPALPMEKLPKIDLVLLSHAHMDHCDLPSLRALEGERTQLVTAWRTSDLVRVRNFQAVTELRWDEATQVGPARVRAFEVKHWGARVGSDTWRGYNGYLIEVGRRSVLFGGDTALTDTFRALKRSRPVDLGIMPIGAYNPWIRAHCNPEQAMEMLTSAGVESIAPVHHKTFALGREPVTEPLERLLAAAGRSEDRVLIREIGQEAHIG